MSPYRILGLSTSATEEEIKKAYKKLAMKHHPDRGGDPIQFKIIQEAYQDLTKKPKDPDFTYGNDFDDFMKSVFRNKKTKVIKKVSVSFEQVYSGDEFRVDNEKITLAPGIREGRYSMNGKIIEIVLKPHRLYLRNNNDLLVNLEVEWYEALLGREYQLEHLSGKTFKFRIPPNSYTGSVIRLSKQGLPVTANPDNFGDLYIKISVKKMNQKELTKPLLDAIITQYESDLNKSKTLR